MEEKLKMYREKFIPRAEGERLREDGAMTLEEDRIVLHDLKGVNLRVGFFLGTREEFLKDTKCISYSLCWDTVDVKVDQITVSEILSELDFYYVTQQLIIDEHVIAGEVIDFRCERNEGGLTASCTILLGRDY
jgi:hypothetical protein